MLYVLHILFTTFKTTLKQQNQKKRIHNFVIIQTIHNRLLTERDHIISITTVPST